MKYIPIIFTGAAFGLVIALLLAAAAIIGG